jgi:hypothetical protein
MANRNYNFADADMTQTSRTKRQHYINHKADFTELDPVEFTVDFETDWLAAIEAAEGAETAEARDDQQRQETDDVNTEMGRAKAKYGEAKYFIEKVHGGTPTADKFGLDDYEEASKSQSETANFLQRLYNTCNSATYKPDLITAGFTQPKIDEILTIKNDLVKEDTEQNVFGENSGVDTKERIDILNACWLFSQKANKASKVIYREQPELLNLFLFPRGSEDDEVFNLLGNVKDAANAPVKGVEIAVIGTGIGTKTNANGGYGMAAIPAGTYNVTFTKTGYNQVTQSVTIVADVPFTLNISLTAL